MISRAGGVDRSAPEDQAAKHRFAVAWGIRHGTGRRLRERRQQAWRQRQLDEKRDALAGLHRLVLGIHVTDGAAKPHDLACHGVAQQREVSSWAFARSLDQPASRAEIDAEQLTQLTARPCRQMSRHLVLDVCRERNSAYLPRTYGVRPVPGSSLPPRMSEKLMGPGRRMAITGLRAGQCVRGIRQCPK